MPSVSCPNCHREFIPIYYVNMFDLDRNGKPQKGWVICTECNEIILPKNKLSIYKDT